MLKDNRQVQRFSIAVPASVESNTGSSSLPPYVELFSRDVSSGGAFFLTSEPLDVGTRVRVRMCLQPRYLLIPKGKRAQVTISGDVLRTDNQGMAIRFGRNYKITSVGE